MVIFDSVSVNLASCWNMLYGQFRNGLHLSLRLEIVN
jgi:hypothetical protein